MGRLERKLDLGAIRRVLAGIKPQPEPLKRKPITRPGFTYRAAWRNICRSNRPAAVRDHHRARAA